MRMYLLLLIFASGTLCYSAATTLSGRVCDLFGEPLSKANVELWSGQKMLKSTSTDETGGYRISDLSAGTFVLVFKSRGFREETFILQLDRSNVYFNVGLQVGDLIDMPPIEVAGLITDTGAIPMRSVRVSIAAHLNSRLKSEAHTDSSGHYRVFVPEPGEYVLTVHARRGMKHMIIVVPAANSAGPIRADVVFSQPTLK